MELTKYVACICEGAAEAAIMRTLLDHDRLIFSYDDLLDGDILRCRSAKNFEEQHLRLYRENNRSSYPGLAS